MDHTALSKQREAVPTLLEKGGGVFRPSSFTRSEQASGFACRYAGPELPLVQMDAPSVPDVLRRTHIFPAALAAARPPSLTEPLLLTFLLVQGHGVGAAAEGDQDEGSGSRGRCRSGQQPSRRQGFPGLYHRQRHQRDRLDDGLHPQQ